MADSTFRCYVYKEAEGHYIADCLDLTLMGEGKTMDDAIAELREAVLGYLEAVYAKGWEEDLIPRRAPLYRWVEFYKHLASYILKAMFARRFDGFLAYEERPEGDRDVNYSEFSIRRIKDMIDQSGLSREEFYGSTERTARKINLIAPEYPIPLK